MMRLMKYVLMFFGNQYLKIFWSGLLMLLFYQCAQIVPLTGGEKDRMPPKLVSTFPENKSTNITPQKIVFTFNEKIQLINPNENIIVIPNLKHPVKWTVKNKTLEVLIIDTLQKNTTYKIILNKAVADLTEKNTLDNIEYVFSTGKALDSLYIKGTVQNAYTLEKEKSVLVALYDDQSNDSIILKEKPLYFTRTNADGNYNIEHLPAKNFKLIAYTDNNNNFYYDPLKEKIGFTEKPINPEKDSIIDFLITEEQPFKNPLKRIYAPDPYHIFLIYNFPDRYKLVYSKNQLQIINDTIPSDTCKILVKSIDTALFVIKNSFQQDTIKKALPINKKFKPHYTIPYTTQQYPYFKPIIIYANHWIDSNWIANKIIMYKDKDSTHLISLNKYLRFSPDKIFITYPLQQNSSYVLKLPVKSMYSNDSIEYQKIVVKTTSAENYAQLTINILFPEKKNYIVTLCNTQHKIMYAQSIHLPIAASNLQSVTFKNLIPDTYLIKIIQDDNLNHQWDKHKYLLHYPNKQFAEKIFMYPKPIKLINNWDIVMDWKDIK